LPSGATQPPTGPFPAPAAPLTLGALSESTGPTAGGTYLTLKGTGFEINTTVTLDGTAARIYYGTSTELRFTTRPHPAGVVDVVVTTGDGRAAGLPAGYIYVAPRFTDFNGVWEGRLGDETETSMAFTVENDTVVTLSCGTTRTWTLGAATGSGEFAVVDDVRMTGGLVDANYARGTIDIPGCSGYDTAWFAIKR
jgi:hypothetical protein